MWQKFKRQKNLINNCRLIGLKTDEKDTFLRLCVCVRVCVCTCAHMHTKSLQSGPTLCDAMDSSAHGILQARIVEWVAMPSSRGSSRPRDRTLVSQPPAWAGGFFTTSTTWAGKPPTITQPTKTDSWKNRKAKLSYNHGNLNSVALPH